VFLNLSEFAAHLFGKISLPSTLGVKKVLGLHTSWDISRFGGTFEQIPNNTLVSRNTD
jgi:hypothetical protein